MEKASAEVDQFIQDTKGLCEGELKDQANELMRAFLVLVNETKVDLKNGGQAKTSMTCHTVLVGPGEAVEKLMAKTKEISHKDGHMWENKEQIQKI